MHNLRKEYDEKRRVQDLHEYARGQYAQLIASVRLANDCCRVLKRPPTYSISNDPIKTGIFDLNTPSTGQMRIIARQSGPAQFGWKSQGEIYYREISMQLFTKELAELQVSTCCVT